LHDRRFSDSGDSHIINVPIEKVDTVDWLFILPVAECPIRNKALNGESAAAVKQPRILTG